MKFLTPLLGEFISGTNKFKLTRDFLCTVFGHGTIRVPVGFQTDFASIPKVLLWYIDTDDPVIREAAVVHDYLYSTAMYPREVADRILIEGMRVLGASQMQRFATYCGVRIGGGSHYGTK
jgi:hypothetical protein